MNPTRSSVYFGYTELRKKKEADSQRFLYKQRTSVFKSTTYENMNIYLHYCGYMYDALTLPVLLDSSRAEAVFNRQNRFAIV